MNRLYLVRHARTQIDPRRHHSQWELDPAGADLLRELAALPHWAAAYRIVSSSEAKAAKTAEEIARVHHLAPVERLAGLQELHKGSFVANHAEAMETLFKFPDRPVGEGWETAQAALARFSAAMEGLIAEAGGRDLIVVSHGTVLSLYLAWVQGKSQVELADWGSIGMPDFCVIETHTMRVIQRFGEWQMETRDHPERQSPD